ncbi:hypothetical protein HLH17_02170 [Acinetobacter sp. ANC 5380]|uniref:DUF4398 domain-containing protein n=1 Tax=Acinetobacter terrae TaxID=2731247 RepID=A0A7Y2W9R0_9GAMM|nr:hypothetical protein [Acinetobacter terrae]NNH76507.1 hypothetical protein [Acinetobacter terrae]
MKKYLLFAIISFFMIPSYASDSDFLTIYDTQVEIARAALKKAVNDGVHPDEYFDIAFVAVRKSLKYRADTKENLYYSSQKIANIASQEAYYEYIEKQKTRHYDYSKNQ